MTPNPAGFKLMGCIWHLRNEMQL